MAGSRILRDAGSPTVLTLRSGERSNPAYGRDVSEACGVLLTGGTSRRLGVDKATLTVDDGTLAERAAAKLRAVCDVVVEIGPGHTDLTAVRERPAGAGPLAALVAGAQALAERGATGAVILLGVDLPNVPPVLLELLRDWPGASTAVPVVDGHAQLVCARYGADALLSAASLVEGGASSLRALLDVVTHDLLDERVWGDVATADSFVDVDTPADAARLGIRLEGHPRPSGLP